MTIIKDFNSFVLDENGLLYFNQYLENNFNKKFYYGQGTEQVLELLSTYGKGPNWIDLGCGTTTLFWSIALDKVLNIYCADKYVEALKVLHDFIISDEIPGCYCEVLNMFSKPTTFLTKNRQNFKEYFAFDVMKTWPEYLDSTRYDLITEFGTFSLSCSSEAFIDCFMEAARHLIKGGRIIGANWIRSETLVNKDGCDNSYLTTDLIEKASKQAGLNLLTVEKINISDSLYPSVILFAMEK